MLGLREQKAPAESETRGWRREEKRLQWEDHPDRLSGVLQANNGGSYSQTLTMTHLSAETLSLLSVGVAMGSLPRIQALIYFFLK